MMPWYLSLYWRALSTIRRPTCSMCSLACRPIWGRNLCEVCDEIPEADEEWFKKARPVEPSSTLARGHQIEADFYRLKAQEIGPKSDEAEVRSTVEEALSKLYMRDY